MVSDRVRLDARVEFREIAILFPQEVFPPERCSSTAPCFTYGAIASDGDTKMSKAFKLK